MLERSYICKLPRIIISGNAKDLIGQLILCRCSAEGVVRKARHTVRNVHLLKGGTVVKCSLSNKGNALGDRHLLQALGNVGLVGLVSACAKDIAKPSNVGILKGRANEGQRDLLEVLTVRKGTKPDDQLLGVRIRNGYLLDTQTHKGIIANVVERLGDRQLADSRVGKGIIVDTLHLARLADRKLIQRDTAVEGKIRDLCDRIGNRDVGKALAPVEGTLIYAAKLIALGKGNRRQILAVGKGIVVDGHHARGHVNLSNGRAIECAVSEGKNIGISQEADLGHSAILKGAKSDHLNACGNGDRARASCRNGNQLASCNIGEQSVNRLVVGICGIHLEGRQVGESNKGVLSDVGHVLRDRQGSEPRLIEGVAHHHKVSTSPRHALKACRIAEGVVIDQRNAARERQSLDVGIRKGLLGDLGQCDARGEGQGRDSALLERRAPQRLQGCGKGHALQGFGPFKSRSLDHRQFPVCRKAQILNRRVGKGFSANELHTCRNCDRLQRRMQEGFRLNGDQRVGKNDVLHRGEGKGTSANIGDLSAKIQGREIQRLGASQIFQKRNAAIGHRGVCPFLGLGDVRHAKVVTANAVVPVLIQSRRHRGGGKIQVDVVRSQEGEAANMLETCRERDVGKTVAIVEGEAADVGHTLRDHDARQTLAEAEGKVVNVGDLGVTKINGGQCTHTLKAVCLDRGQRRTAFKGNALQIVASVKHICRNARQLAVRGKGEGGHVAASLKRSLRNGRHVCGHAEGGQAAIGECMVADARQAAVVAQGNRRKGPAERKGLQTDLRHAVRDLHELQA